MAGLPRSGSTLLTAILNQHPDIYASPQTDLLQMMYLLDSNIPNFESYRAGINHNGYRNSISGLGELFYEKIDKPFIVDKNRAWGTPYNLNLARLLNPNVRILVLIRPILEILTSFLTLAKKNPEVNFIDRSLKDSQFFPNFYRNLDDARCDWLMRPNGEIDQAILSLAQTKYNPDNFLFIDYDDLILKPQITLESIYSFLNISNFQHNFRRINHTENQALDGEVFGIPELHEIRPELKRISSNPIDVLSNYVLEKYSNALDFLKD